MLRCANSRILGVTRSHCHSRSLPRPDGDIWVHYQGLPLPRLVQRSHNRAPGSAIKAGVFSKRHIACSISFSLSCLSSGLRRREIVECLSHISSRPGISRPSVSGDSPARYRGYCTYCWVVEPDLSFHACLLRLEFGQAQRQAQCKTGSTTTRMNPK